MSYRPHIPDGSNHSLNSAISADGTAPTGIDHRVPPRCGVAVRVGAGDMLRVINTHGTQVCDFWAFSADNLYEYLSMSHCHTELETVMPKTGDTLVSNRRQPIITICEDDSPGVHDTVIACCDWPRYRRLGCTEYHDNCADNLRMALAAIGFEAPHVPDPFNLWMNIPIADQDASPEMAAMARELFGLEVDIMSFDQLELDASFDAIWASFSLLHIPKSALPDVLSVPRLRNRHRNGQTGPALHRVPASGRYTEGRPASARGASVTGCREGPISGYAGG